MTLLALFKWPLSLIHKLLIVCCDQEYAMQRGVLHSFKCLAPSQTTLKVTLREDCRYIINSYLRLLLNLYPKSLQVILHLINSCLGITNLRK